MQWSRLLKLQPPCPRAGRPAPSPLEADIGWRNEFTAPRRTTPVNCHGSWWYNHARNDFTWASRRRREGPCGHVAALGDNQTGNAQRAHRQTSSLSTVCKVYSITSKIDYNRDQASSSLMMMRFSPVWWRDLRHSLRWVRSRIRKSFVLCKLITLQQIHKKAKEICLIENLTQFTLTKTFIYLINNLNINWKLSIMNSII